MSTIVFDADDTLWMNEGQYSAAAATFFAYLYEVLRYRVPNLHYLKNRYYQIDGELFATWGITRGRVAESMVRTYRDVCDWAEWRFPGEDFYSDEHERRIREIGDTPFKFQKLRWLAGARPVLTRLKEQGHTLCLLTSYDRSVFPAKSDFLSLDTFFDPAHVRAIEGKKTPEDFQVFPASPRMYAVGNGESDILPALNLGDHWQGIYIPHGSTSKYFEDTRAQDSPVPPPLNYFMPPPFDHPRVTTIYRIEDFPYIP